MRSRIPLTGLVLLLLWAVVACDSKPSPTAPSPTPNLGLLSIGGNTGIGAPGQTTQLTALLKSADGSVRDVTSEATWRTNEAVTSVVAPGRLQAVSYGKGIVTVAHRSAANVAQAEIRVAPAGTFLVTGTVKTSAGLQWMVGIVEAVSAVGTISVSLETGQYTVPASGDTTLRLVLGDARMAEKRLTVTADRAVDFEFTRADAGPATGQYTVTFSAATSCSLPAAAMQRTWPADVEEIQQVWLIKVKGDFVAWGGETGFTGVRAADTIRFTIRDTYDDGFNLVERVAGVGDLHFAGSATGTLTEGRIRATFDGSLALGPGRASLLCSAPDHVLELVRTGS